MLYGCETTIVFTLKIESELQNILFGLKMMVKSGLEKIILKSLHAGRWSFLLMNLWFWEFYEWEISSCMEEFQNNVF